MESMDQPAIIERGPYKYVEAGEGEVGEGRREGASQIVAFHVEDVERGEAGDGGDDDGDRGVEVGRPEEDAEHAPSPMRMFLGAAGETRPVAAEVNAERDVVRPWRRWVARVAHEPIGRGGDGP